MDNPEPRSQYLNVVLRLIERTSLRIPQFQRSFVWTRRDILELLGSIQRGYPIGSVLTWRVDNSEHYFAGFRENPFPPARDDLAAFEVILDGAQRLSCLYGCLKNSSSDPIYQVAYDLVKDEFVHRDEHSADPAVLLPMDSLFDSRQFLAVQTQLSGRADSDRLLNKALHLYSTFQDYQIPIISLANAELDDVVEVFRRVNSSGTALSSVDFVRALTWQSNFDLQDTFESISEHFQYSPVGGLDEDFIVRCLAISADVPFDSRGVVQLERLSKRPGGLTREIGGVVDALEAVAAFGQRLNVTSIQEIPYEIQRLVLFAVKHFSIEVPDSRLEDWFWRSTFAEEHQSKPESYALRLVREIRNGSIDSALEIKKPLDAELLSKRNRRSGSAITTGFDLLLRSMGARSLLSGAQLTDGATYPANLYTRRALDEASLPLGTNVLANTVLLDREDAKEWKAAQLELPVESLYRLASDRRDDASEVWASQGLTRFLQLSPEQALRERSWELLATVIPGIG